MAYGSHSQTNTGAIDAINATTNKAAAGANDAIEAITKDSDAQPRINTSTSDAINASTNDADAPPHINANTNNAINTVTKDANAAPHVDPSMRDDVNTDMNDANVPPYINAGTTDADVTLQSNTSKMDEEVFADIASFVRKSYAENLPLKQVNINLILLFG